MTWRDWDFFEIYDNNIFFFIFLSLKQLNVEIIRFFHKTHTQYSYNKMKK